MKFRLIALLVLALAISTYMCPNKGCVKSDSKLLTQETDLENSTSSIALGNGENFEKTLKSASNWKNAKKSKLKKNRTSAETDNSIPIRISFPNIFRLFLNR